MTLRRRRHDRAQALLVRYTQNGVSEAMRQLTIQLKYRGVAVSSIRSTGRNVCISVVYLRCIYYVRAVGPTGGVVQAWVIQ